ncbi:MAG: ATP-grasp domain-containing protein [Polyangiales bacterium]
MNHHEGGVFAGQPPAPGVTADAEAEAQRMAKALLEATDYVGVLAIELFDTPDGWLINELAPRVHNSGHWTQDGAVTSQFENHVRAIAGLPLGATDARGHSLMVNILGEEPPLEALLAVPGARAHRYRKSAAPGRKLAHVNVCAETAEARDAALEQLGPLLGVHPARSGARCLAECSLRDFGCDCAALEEWRRHSISNVCMP